MRHCTHTIGELDSNSVIQVSQRSMVYSTDLAAMHLYQTHSTHLPYVVKPSNNDQNNFATKFKIILPSLKLMNTQSVLCKNYQIILTYGTKYLRMDQVKLVEGSL